MSKCGKFYVPIFNVVDDHERKIFEWHKAIQNA